MSWNKRSYDFTGKIPIVTGAAQDIGKSVARVSHRNGATAVISDVQAEKAEAKGIVIDTASITGVLPLRLHIAFVAAKAVRIKMTRHNDI